MHCCTYLKAIVINSKLWVEFFLGFTKVRTFFISYKNHVLLGGEGGRGCTNLTTQAFFLHHRKNILPLLFILVTKRIYLDTHFKEELLVCFEKFQGVLYSHRQSIKRMMSTFITVNTTPICKR